MVKKEWKARKISLGNAIILSAVMAVLGAVVGLNWRNWFGGAMVAVSGGVDWSSLDEVYNQLASSYNGEIKTVELVNGAKKGLVEAIGDVYTVYMDTETSADFYDDLHGNVGAGIGVEMGLRDGYVRVLRVLPDNPAVKAGIMKGDILYKVDGEEVYTLSSSEIAKLVRGEAGSKVTVSIVRDGKEMEFTMVREEINNVSEYVSIEGETAIVTVTRFDTNTGKEVQAEAAKFVEAGVKKVILDLRGNGGGYVSAAQDLLSLWLDSQEILTQKSRHFGNTTMSSAAGKAILKDMKTVVLVNGSSASASEIVAGALQDYGKATIVGETTYGKGVVQNLYTLSDGSLLKVTTAEWYTPKDRTIHETGIKPDVEVELTAEDVNKMRDPQLDKAKAL